MNDVQAANKRLADGNSKSGRTITLSTLARYTPPHHMKKIYKISETSEEMQTKFGKDTLLHTSMYTYTKTHTHGQG